MTRNELPQRRELTQAEKREHLIAGALAIAERASDPRTRELARQLLRRQGAEVETPAAANHGGDAK